MSHSTKRIIIFAIIFVLIAGISFGVMSSQIISKRAQLTEQIDALAAERAQEASRIQLQRIAAESEAEREKLAGYFFERESESIDFLNEIETLAPQVGVSLETSNLEVVTDDTDGSQWVQTQFAFSGSRNDVQRFVRILETVPYVSRVIAVSLESQTSSIWKANATIEIQIFTYENS